MYVTNVTEDYDKITSTKCTNKDKNIDLIIPTLLFTIPCDLSILCLISLMVYTLLKPLFNKKNNGKIFIPKTSSSLYHSRT